MNGLPPARYQGVAVALLTQHGKQDLVRPILESHLGCQLIHTEACDTDLLGTFTRDVARTGTQLEACRTKARIGMALTGATVGLASEGAFGPDPYTGFMPWDAEMLLWIDQSQGLEVVGLAQGPAQSLHGAVQSVQELTQFAAAALFPEHHLVLRPEHQDHPAIYKNLHDTPSLMAAFHAAQAMASNGVVFVENDLRAFGNPTRQDLIRQAAQDLVRKLLSHCPHCQAPGYWPSHKVPGLLCKQCLKPTRLPIAEHWLCTACTHQEQRPVNAGEWADPGQCDACNP